MNLLKLNRLFLAPLIIAFLILPAIVSGNTIHFKDKKETLEIGHQITILNDSSNTLTIDDVIHSKLFYAPSQKVANLGLTDYTYWVKIEVKNHTDENKLLLEIAEPSIDEITFYEVNGNSSVKEIRVSEDNDFVNRIYQDPNYIFDMNIPAGTTGNFYLKLASKQQILLPIKIGSKTKIFEQIKYRDFFTGIYCGLMAIMIFYNLFIYFSVLDKSYLLYVIYTLLILLTQTSTQGYTFQHLWPEVPWMATHSLFLFPALVGVAFIEFTKNFLKMKEYTPKMWRGTFIVHICYIIGIAAALSGYYVFSYKFIEITAAFISFYMLAAAIIISRKYRPAKFYLVAWSIFLIGVIVFVLKDFGVLPYNTITRYTMQAGSAIEAVLLSFALADRINIFRKEKEEAQANELRERTEKQKILEQQTIFLEEKVKERTIELEQAQAQLVQNEKLASVGQLAAGMAHEINNPMNFITSSLGPLKLDIEDVINLIKVCSEIDEDGDLKAKFQEIKKLKNELDVDFLMEEIKSLIASIESGAERTTEIIKNLRIFSRVDETDKKVVSVEDGINSTLEMVKSKLENITVIKNFEGDQMLECYAGKLNQVFMNIMVNAIDAIDEAGHNKGTLTIDSKNDNEKFLITFSDNGKGMSSSVIEKIFDPFFTTKDVGKGTGLGLSISYGIIEAHEGKIEVESKEGEGSTFSIYLPVK